MYVEFRAMSLGVERHGWRTGFNHGQQLDG
jgi:hypothetical protein